LYSGFTVIGPALISHPVRALIKAKPMAWGFSLHKGAAGPSSRGKTRVWRETRTKRSAVRRGNTNGRNFLGRQYWRSFLGRQCWRSFWGCQSCQRREHRELLGAEGERKWAELLRLPVMAELPRLSVLSERLVATEQKTFFVRAFARAGVAEATLVCICVRRVWAAGCGRFAMCGAGAESVARIRRGGYYDSQRLPQTQCKSSSNNNNRWFISLAKHVVHTSTLSGPCSSFLSSPLRPFLP
jgi:hypothetical protein